MASLIKSFWDDFEMKKQRGGGGGSQQKWFKQKTLILTLLDGLNQLWKIFVWKHTLLGEDQRWAENKGSKRRADKQIGESKPRLANLKNF